MSQDDAIEALAGMRLLSDKVLPSAHPTRIPYLLAAAITTDDTAEKQEAVDEARRVHRVAHGGGDELFETRFKAELDLVA